MPCPNCGKAHPAGSGHAQSARQQGPKVGELALKVELPDLAGSSVELADFGGSDTLVLFWNPACGFCQQMLRELKAC